MSIQPGTRLGPYEVVGVIGAGGMGEVYRARDTRLDRSVAIKVLPPRVADDAHFRARFEREARVLASLNHPNIATVHGVEERDGLLALVMELVEGRSLAERTVSLPVAEALDIAIQTATGIAAAHAAGVIHRDLKPSNLMLRPDGYVKVLDFGLAKATGTADSAVATEALGMTAPGAVMGTLRYMSPEQARGLPLDARTDIFSFGVVLYEMLAGQSPYGATAGLEVASAILNDEPAPLATHANGVPPELERIVGKAMRKERDERYQTVGDLLRDLRALRANLAGSSSHARKPVVSSDPGWATPRRGIAAAIAMLVAGAAFTAYFATGRRQALDSVAILPLAHAGTEPDTEYLADGITESLINNLSQVSGLRVMSRSSAFRYKGRDLDPRKAGQELNVDAVLAGRIEPRGDHLAISLELVDVSDGRQLWGEQYSQPLGDLLQVQLEVSREVSTTLRLRLSGVDERNLSQPPTHSAEAYRLYLRGRFQMQKLTAEAVTSGIDDYLQALQRDPAFALAYVGLAESYILLGTDSVPPTEALPKAAAYAKKALSLDPDLPGAHAAMGIVKLVYDWDFRGAEQELRAEGALTSQSIESFSCALHYADPLDRNRDAVAALQSALAIDPLSLPVNLELGCASYYGRHYDQAIRQFQGTLTLYPDHPFATFELGRALAQQKKYVEALAAMGKVSATAGDWPPIVSESAYVHAASGEREKALTLLDVLREQRSRRFVDPYLIAAVHAGLGDKDQAFMWLDRAVAEKSGWLPWLKVEPKWDSLRADPRYVDLLRRVGLSV